VEINRALGDAGAFGDVIQSGRGEPARDEFVERSIDDGLTPFRSPCRAA